MPSASAVNLCKPCLNRKYPLRKQLLLSFLSLAAVSLLLALAVVMGTTEIIGNKARTSAENSLEEQIKRHLKNASTEAAATIGEKFRRLQYGVLNVTSYGLRDALQENLILAGGAEGYPLSTAHTDLRDTEITDSAEANLVTTFERQNIPVDLDRSVWYYADGGSFNALVATGNEDTIDKTARLDLLWPTMYANSDDTKGVFVGVPLPVFNWPVFRYFPGNELSAELGDVDNIFACESDSAQSECYDATERDWYVAAVDDDTGVSDETALGDVIVTDPYIDGVGSEKDWLVTIARAVYGDTGSTSGQLLGVAGVDVLLESVQESVEEINFLESGYSILATAGEGVVLAAPSSVWDRDEAEESTTVCELTNGMCTDSREWEDLLSGEVVSFVSTSFSDNGEAKDAILIAAPVAPTYNSETGAAVVTHYILSAVAREEIFAPSEGMATLIRESTDEILIVTVSVAAATLIAVAAAVCALSGGITRPIAKMTSAARSIAKDGAKTDVFGSVAETWGGKRGGSSAGGSTAGGGGASRRTRAVDYLLCRGEDEISTLAREFSLMITGLGKRGAAARATGLEDSSVYPKNPFTTEFARAPPTAPSAPSAPSAPPR